MFVPLLFIIYFNCLSFIVYSLPQVGAPPCMSFSVSLMLLRYSFVIASFPAGGYTILSCVSFGVAPLFLRYSFVSCWWVHHPASASILLQYFGIGLILLRDCLKSVFSLSAGGYTNLRQLRYWPDIASTLLLYCFDDASILLFFVQACEGPC